MRLAVPEAPCNRGRRPPESGAQCTHHPHVQEEVPVQVRRVTVSNFRGVRSGQVLLDGHTLLVGGNSVGKSTLCEALDLVLGPERMFRRPTVDEYDFHGARYLATPDEAALEILIEVVLVNLSEVAQRRFQFHLRKWDEAKNDFADLEAADPADADAHAWCLPVLFCGRFNPEEDDFEGGTFFAHPEPVNDDITLVDTRLGAGRSAFTREDKRHCGYLYLRPNRTGSRALSLQRGSLLDTIVRLGADPDETLWEDLRAQLAGVDLAADGSAFAKILDGVATRVGQFLALGADKSVQVHPSDLTREGIREALKVFIASQPGTFPVPFARLSTGSLNLLVFALLTYIAELKGDQTVIFAIEEPEIALPPHSQRRLVEFALTRMGQAIVTSHSPYVIERFDPDRIVVLRRGDGETLAGQPITLPEDFKLNRYRDAMRRQFAEAVLARAVLVVEGATEATVFPAVAAVLDADPSIPYTHPDLAGVSVLDANNDISVPLFAPLFKNLGKPAYGVHDQPKNPFAAELTAKAGDFVHYEVIPYKGVEDLLVAEMPEAVKRRFLEKAAGRPDYPDCAKATDESTAEKVDQILREVLTARKGAGWRYAADLVAEAADSSELPETLVDILLRIDKDLGATALPYQSEGPGPARTATEGDPRAATDDGSEPEEP